MFIYVRYFNDTTAVFLLNRIEYHQYGGQSKTEEALIVGHASSWGHTSSENYKKFTEEVILNWGVL